MYGYRVLTAADGSQGLALYAQHREEIGLVLTDMMMPVMDGAATIRALRKMDPGVRIIGASGLTANGKSVVKRGLGEKSFLHKPYAADKLLKTVRDVLDGE